MILNYKQNWEAKDIVRYVCLLEDGKFASLADALLDSFVEQGITGAELLDIEKNDLFTMGVKNFKDRTKIYKYFQNLKSNEGDDDTVNID